MEQMVGGKNRQQRQRQIRGKQRQRRNNTNEKRAPKGSSFFPFFLFFITMQDAAVTGRGEQDTATGLLAMPVEVVLGIGRFLERLRDAAACVMASPIFPPCLVHGLAVRRFCDDPEGAIDAGAPLDIVVSVLPAGAPVEPLLVPAVRRGARDIVEWLCCRLEEQRADATTQETCADAGCGCPSFCGYSHHHRHRHFAPEAGQGAESAMAAIGARRADLLSALLRTEVPSLDRSKRTQIMCMTRAAQVGDVGTVAMLHQLARTGHFTARGGPSPATCGCCREVAYEAFFGGHVPLLDWLRENGCDAAPHAYDQKMVEAAMWFRDDPPLQWLFDTAPPDWRLPDVGPNWMRNAASMGSLACVRIMHDRGLGICDLGVLRNAANCGQLNILKWAIGEAVGDAPARDRPIEAWHSVTIAWAAAVSRGTHIIEWMLSRPDTASAVTPKMIACALARGHADVALLAHARGVLPLDQWDAVDAAARSGSVDAVRAVIQGGAVYKASALTTALNEGHVDVTVYLCDLYGTVDAQHAIDSMSSYRNSAAWKWLRDHVPGVCVAHALAATWAMSYNDSDARDALCQCARCAPSAPP